MSLKPCVVELSELREKFPELNSPENRLFFGTPLEVSDHLWRTEVEPLLFKKEIPKSVRIEIAGIYLEYKNEVVEFTEESKRQTEDLVEGYKKILSLIEQMKKKYDGKKDSSHE